MREARPPSRRDAQRVDLGVLVVRAGQTPRQSVRLAAAKFQRSGNDKVGIVLNDLDAERHGSDYRYQYYGRYGEDGSTDETPSAKTGSA